MKEHIESLQVKLKNGEFKEYPLGVKGEYVQLNNGKNLEEAILDTPPKKHDSPDNQYGVGSEQNYGHLKITDSYDIEGAGDAQTAVSQKGIAEMFEKLPVDDTQGINLLAGTNLNKDIGDGYWKNLSWSNSSAGDGKILRVPVTDCPDPNIKYGWRITDNTTGNKDVSQRDIPYFIEGKVYTISFYAKAIKNSPKLLVRFNTGSEAEYIFNETIDNIEYKLFKKTIVTKYKYTYVQFGLSGDSGDIEICGCKLEAGIVEDPIWTPNYKDILENIDDLHTIGGTNLIPMTNQGLKTNKGLNIWVIWSANNTLSAINYPLADGTIAIELHATGERSNHYYLASMTNKALGLFNGLKLQPLTTYTLSFKVMANFDYNGDVLIANMDHRFILSKNKEAYSVPGDGLWHTVVIQLITNDIPGSADNQEKLLNEVYGLKFTGWIPSEENFVRFKDLKLEIDNVATDWSPAPEDFAPAVHTHDALHKNGEISITTVTADSDKYPMYSNFIDTGTGGIKYHFDLGVSKDGQIPWIHARDGYSKDTFHDLYTNYHKPTAQDVGALPLTGGAVTGDLIFSGAERHIKYASGVRTGTIISFYAGAAEGNGIVIGDGGRVIIGSGESAHDLRTALIAAGSNDAAEELHLASDGSVFIHVKCQTIADRITVTINSNGNISAPGGFTGNLIGTADVANKLGNTTIGSTKQPIYINHGVPTPCDAIEPGGVIISDTAPDNKKVIWMDSSGETHIPKYYDGTKWAIFPAIWS